jgi:AraC family transcriptional regulator
MPQPIEEMLTVGAEMRMPLGIAQLVQLKVIDPIDIVMFDRDAYWLELCLSPRARNARACYRDHWTAQRFERIGSIYCLPPGETIQTRSDAGAQHDSILCHLHPASMTQLFEGEMSWTDQRLKASLDIADDSIRHLLIRLARELRHPGFASQMLVELIAAQLAIELGRYFVRFEALPSTGRLAEWRLDRIEERLRQVDSVPALDELARLCDISVRQLTRGFRASRGCSIGDYVVGKRIDTAKRLLSAGESIKNIAFATGFPSASAFGYAFRRASGMTPREFRAQKRLC